LSPYGPLEALLAQLSVGLACIAISLSHKGIITLPFIYTGTSCFRGYGRRNGERRKLVHECIVS